MPLQVKSKSVIGQSASVEIPTIVWVDGLRASLRRMYLGVTELMGALCSMQHFLQSQQKFCDNCKLRLSTGDGEVPVI